jgi:16S rRNA (adenine1518-N6/adenine1519-N6)-dimethyltransferase
MFLEARGMAAQKKFGQNFLIHEGARNALVDALDIQAGDAVWEIGPGLGAMTRLLLDRGARVTVFEIDRGFIRALRELFPAEIAGQRLTVVEGDVLKTWHEVSAGFQDREPVFLLGNLPYNIAGTLLADFIENRRLFRRSVVTVQKEVADRIMAAGGGKTYSSLTVLCSLFYDTRKVRAMKGAFFYPPPNVDSTGVCFDRKETVPAVPGIFFPLTRALFARRRKTVYNNLYWFLAGRKTMPAMREEETAALCEAALAVRSIPKTVRPDHLQTDDFEAVAAFLAEQGFT